MKKWKDWSRSEKIMILLIVMLLIGIITRWGYVKKEAAESVERYFKSDTTLRGK